MKKLYLFAALAAMLAACSENDLTKETAVQQNAEEGAVQFGAYVNRGTTRAGYQSILSNTADLQTSASNSSSDVYGGFGVFGYYTNDELYSQNSKPEFFYNQKVYYSSGWSYSPIKYWPNEFGSDAQSQAEDKLTFFAYAPYVPVNINTGIAQQTKDGLGDPIDELETGIISLTRNTALGDPYVKYYASFDPEKCVDLCFGVAKEAFTSSVDGNNNTVEAGKPYIDVKKPKLSDRIYFDFKHALAQLNVQIDADVDVMSHKTENYLDGATKIYVREVTFQGFADKGMLNLNSEATGVDYTPKWVDLSGINEIKTGKVTIYDGRRDGREGQVNARASNEKPQNLNPIIISNEGNSSDGVPADQLVNLFSGETKDASILVIPTEEPLSVTIVYDVETEDDNLASFLSDGKKHGSSVENKITKEIKIGTEDLKLAAGKSYVVKLHLGMTSVKFEASVTEWTSGGEANTDLPVNAPSYAAALGGTVNATVPYSVTTGIFQVTGLATGGFEAGYPKFDGEVTGTLASTNPTTVTAEMNGTADFGYTVAENTKPKNLSGSLVVKQGSSEATLSITQQACPLGLEATSIGADSRSIVLKAATATGMTTEWTSANVILTRDRDGVKTNLAQVSTTPATGQFQVTGSTYDGGNIALFDKMEPGDVYTITVAVGDAAPETVTFTVGGIKLAPVSIEYGSEYDLVPQYYGSVPTAYTGCTPTSGDYAALAKDADAVKPTIKTEKVGTNGITITATQADTPGYLFSTASKTATCAVTVTMAHGTISYSVAGATIDTKKTAGNTVGTFNSAVLKNSQDKTLEVGAAKGGEVTYSIVRVTKNGEDVATTTFVPGSSAGEVKVGTDALTVGAEYAITMQATVTSNANANYTVGTAQDVVTFTATEP